VRRLDLQVAWKVARNQFAFSGDVLARDEAWEGISALPSPLHVADEIVLLTGQHIV
jgi:hypothetical protein